MRCLFVCYSSSRHAAPDYSCALMPQYCIMSESGRRDNANSGCPAVNGVWARRVMSVIASGNGGVRNGGFARVGARGLIEGGAAVPAAARRPDLFMVWDKERGGFAEGQERFLLLLADFLFSLTNYIITPCAVRSDQRRLSYENVR